MMPERPKRRQSRRERRESKHATRRLRRFRAGETERLRADALRFTLSEAVVMASLRREAAAIAKPNDETGKPARRTVKRFHAWSGQLRAVDAPRWRWFVDGDRILAFENL